MKGQKALKQIALIKTGCTIDEIKPRHGDFENWFAAGLGVSNLLQIDVFDHQPLPPPSSLAGIVITGSPAMVSARLDWSERTADWLRGAVKTDIPVLGVCYGHQLLAHALGGCAGPNPKGRQIGTVQARRVEYATVDPLLGHLPATFPAQTSHSEVVLELPQGAQRLATSPMDPNFAIRFADKVWGVQFHPEFSAAVVSDYIRYRTADLLREGLDPEKLQRNTAETDAANTVLQKFTEMVRRQA
jgi:GMP synthase (glutamine-hydrolysing)